MLYTTRYYSQRLKMSLPDDPLYDMHIAGTHHINYIQTLINTYTFICKHMHARIACTYKNMHLVLMNINCLSLLRVVSRLLYTMNDDPIDTYLEKAGWRLSFFCNCFYQPLYQCLRVYIGLLWGKE